MYTNRKAFVLKCILVIFVVYICIHVATNTGTSQVIRELQQSGRNLAALDLQQAELIETSPKPPVTVKTSVKQPPPSVKPPTVSDKVKEVTKCLDKPMIGKVQQRGDYWVLYNYIKAEKTFKCHESITYTTHADYSFMDNLIPLLERWKGPISLALHAPGTDFKNTLDSIAYLRDCTDDLVKEFVTFHVYFSTKHVPKEVGL